ncbi:F-box protein At3g07870 isoform X3 [Lolium perenne]|uniref:F-box protein At3g07870 isoform X3 n=1 Tax=Lolium perenne TaxID=4522 RepID=UPI0021F65DA8|nr:F-box protein At3g07870-like isoform X3 [Lolium perenne]
MVSEENQPKKQRNEECFINCLPGDLIEQIFLRLHVSTLLRCIDVCKQWHKIIRDPQFVASHLQHAPHCVLVFFPQESVSGEPYPADAIVIDGAWSHSKYAVPVIGPDDFLCGSCNGLLCLYTKTSTIKIANLATGEHLHLEKPVKNSRGDHFLFYSFGCHPSTKEYKIIHFLADHVEGRYRPHDDNKFSVIQVYTLGDEKWRDIRTPEALSLNCVKNSGAINVDGIMYWLTEDMVASWQHAVMTFDLNEESFARIELSAVAPEDCASGGPRRYWIREIDGKISIATAQTYPSQPRRLVGDLQIWTLDNKAEQRWSQKYNIQYPPDYIPGPNLGHGDKIILPSFGCSLYSYELLGENFRTKLDVYKNAGIVRRPKQRQGWELKKWETWEQELSKNEKSWSVVHKNEHDGNASARRNSIAINGLLPHIVDDEVRKEIGIKINQIFPNFPDQQPRSLRRLNCVAQRQDMESLLARMKNWNSITKATRQVMDTIISMMRSALEDQVGASSSNAGISQNHGEGGISQDHGKGDDTKT